MVEEIMVDIPLLTNVRKFQRYPLDWPDQHFDFPQCGQNINMPGGHFICDLRMSTGIIYNNHYFIWYNNDNNNNNH